MLPLVIAGAGDAEALRRRFASDRSLRVMDAPYGAEQFRAASAELGVRRRDGSEPGVTLEGRPHR